MKLKKFAAVAMAAVMSLAMFTACSGGSGGSGVTVKKIKWSESKSAALENSMTNQAYMEVDAKQGNITVHMELATKGNKTAIKSYMSEQLFQLQITEGTTRYVYQYIDDKGNKLDPPVCTMETVSSSTTTPDTEVEVGTYTIEGKSYYSETVKNGNEGTIYCFDDNGIAAMVSVKNGNAKFVAKISNFRTDNVPDEMFEHPESANQKIA